VIPATREAEKGGPRKKYETLKNKKLKAKGLEYG
jgi:hypothetical protein